MKNNLTEKIYKLMRPVTDTVFPRRCPYCDEPVKPFGALICDACKKSFKYVKEPTCMRCGKPMGSNEEDREYCRDCEEKHHEFDRGFSLLEYRSAAKTMYRFKYLGRREYANFFAWAFAKKYSSAERTLLVTKGKGIFVNGRKLDALIPVPLSLKRMKKRGYNQAEVFARALSQISKTPVLKDYVKRIKNTRPMKELDYYGRRNNLKNAFIIGKNDVSLYSVGIVDDIYTTGSTADALAELLKGHGVRFVYVFTAAIGK